MPGRTVPEALRAYLDPLKEAVACLDGVGKIVTSNSADRVEDVGAWILNGPEGMPLPRFGVFHAQQKYQIVHTDDDHFNETSERFRVSTREYLYKVVLNSGPEIRWHWHPQGNSPEQRPHIHPSFNLKAHLPSGRAVLEEVVEGCIELGATPSCDDYKARLALTGGVHKLYRTWSHAPGDQS